MRCGRRVFFCPGIHGAEAMDQDERASMTKQDPALKGKCFFDHLAHVTTLSIKTPKEGPLGLTGEGGRNGYTPLAVQAGQMPQPTTLHLDYVLVSPELIDFLLSHQDTLEKLMMWNCYVFLRHSTSNGIKWSPLFFTFIFGTPTRLGLNSQLIDS